MATESRVYIKKLETDNLETWHRRVRPGALLQSKDLWDNLSRGTTLRGVTYANDDRRQYVSHLITQSQQRFSVEGWFHQEAEGAEVQAAPVQRNHSDKGCYVMRPVKSHGCQQRTPSESLLFTVATVTGACCVWKNQGWIHLGYSFRAVATGAAICHPMRPSQMSRTVSIISLAVVASSVATGAGKAQSEGSG